MSKDDASDCYKLFFEQFLSRDAMIICELTANTVRILYPEYVMKVTFSNS